MTRTVSLIFVLLLPFATSTDLFAQDKATDYVCGMEVEVNDSVISAEAKGATFYFCSTEHQAEFKKSPDKLIQAASKDYTAWLDPVFGHYFAIRAELAGDRADEVGGHVTALGRWAGGAARLSPPLDAARRQKYQVALVGLQKAAAAFPPAGKADIQAYRDAFKPLSEAMIQYMRGVELKEKSPRTAFLFHCPMAKASWIQETEGIGNPYYGERMLKCGSKLGWNEDETKATKKGGQGGHGGGEGGGGHGCGGCE